MRFIFLFLFLSLQLCYAGTAQRITSVFLSEHFINEELKAHLRPGVLRDLNIKLDTKKNQIYLHGIVQIPLEEIKAINLDPNLSSYRFQVTIKPEATPKGHLILEFPLNETYFYPSNSKNPTRDRVVIPVQMLSLALASARGYFAALSGDYSSFDKKAQKLNALIKNQNKLIKSEKNPQTKDLLINERESLKLELLAIPLERKKCEAMAHELGAMLGFTGEKEINLNETFSARSNAIILKLNISNFTPFLKGVELGGVRIIHDKKDGPHGEDYFAVDINADLNIKTAHKFEDNAEDEKGLKVAPSAILRISEKLFESDLVLNAEKKSMGSKLTDLKIEMKKDGLHVAGKFHKFFFTIAFDTIVDFDNADDVTDAIDVSVRDIEIGGIDLEFMTGFILEAMEHRLDQTLKGICTFEYLGEKADNFHILFR